MSDGQTTSESVDGGAVEAAAETTQAGPRKQQPTPYDELLCTICGLKACWQEPANAQKSATP
jgi:hypothetical protein